MIITKTPLRISFAGGGTDFEDYYREKGGAVVSAGINKYIYITVNRKFDNRIRVSYSKTEMVDEAAELHHELVRECMRLVGIRGGIEITSIADIPSGTGLGSSSAFTVGLLDALYAYAGYSPSAEELAQQACHVEIDLLKHPIGKQDQYAVAYGGLNYFRFNSDGSVDRRRIYLDDHNFRSMRQKLLLFYTGMTRSADEILEEQKQKTEENWLKLDNMKSQADAMAEELITNGFNSRFGKLLEQGWKKKKSLASNISNPKIDEYYEKAIMAGAMGGKLLGAGGGGFLLFYCDEEKQADVEQALSLPMVDFHISSRGSRVIFSE